MRAKLEKWFPKLFKPRYLQEEWNPEREIDLCVLSDKDLPFDVRIAAVKCNTIFPRDKTVLLESLPRILTPYGVHIELKEIPTGLEIMERCVRVNKSDSSPEVNRYIALLKKYDAQSEPELTRAAFKALGYRGATFAEMIAYSELYPPPNHRCRIISLCESYYMLHIRCGCCVQNGVVYMGLNLSEETYGQRTLYAVVKNERR